MITPKEKAKELYSKYTDALNIRDLQITANPFAKQCALICCNEVLGYMGADRGYEFWTNVKQEIQKL